MPQTPKEVTAAEIAGISRALRNVSSSIAGAVDALRKLDKDFQFVAMNGILDELQQFRALERHVLAGTANDDVVANLLRAAQQARAGTAEKLRPIVERLKALSNPSENTEQQH